MSERYLLVSFVALTLDKEVPGKEIDAHLAGALENKDVIIVHPEQQGHVVVLGICKVSLNSALKLRALEENKVSCITKILELSFRQTLL